MDRSQAEQSKNGADHVISLTSTNLTAIKSNGVATLHPSNSHFMRSRTRCLETPRIKKQLRRERNVKLSLKQVHLSNRE